jgi:hypothetical protein
MCVANTNTPFLALFLGVVVAVVINLANERRYRRISLAAVGKTVPEARLLPMAVGALILPIGLFWFGWTAFNVFWLSPVIASVFIGAWFTVPFQQCLNYLVDTYRVYAASAISANTLLRSFFAASFPLIARPMFKNLGDGPTMSILAAVATLILPVPFLLRKYGVALRGKSNLLLLSK